MMNFFDFINKIIVLFNKVHKKKFLFFTIIIFLLSNVITPISNYYYTWDKQNVLLIFMIFSVEFISFIFNFKKRKINKKFLYKCQEESLNFLKDIYSIHWNRIIDLNDKNLDNLAYRGIWAMSQAVGIFIDIVVNFLEIILYTLLIFSQKNSILPFFLILSTNISYAAYLYYNQFFEKNNEKKKKLMDSNSALWDKYWNRLKNADDMIINGDLSNLVQGIKTNKLDIEKNWNKYILMDENFVFYILKMNYFLIFILFCLNNNFPNSDSVMFLFNFTKFFSSYECLIFSVISLFEKFEDFKPLYKVVEDNKKKEKTFQVKHFTTIRITKIKYEYPQVDNRKKFGIYLTSPICLKKGDSVLITGESGHGKSTFYQIISGCICSNEYQSKIFVDNICRREDGFHIFEDIRTYGMQNTTISFNDSLKDIVTSFSNAPFNQKFFDIAIKLTLLNDLIYQFENINVNVDNKLSGGQKQRLTIARILYRTLINESSILILDEPDRNLPYELILKIINNIIIWFKSRGILFLTIHNLRVSDKKLPFTKILNVNNGLISYKNY